MNTETKQITVLQFTEQELEPPPDHRELFMQSQRLLARLLVRAWLEQRKISVDSDP